MDAGNATQTIENILQQTVDWKGPEPGQLGATSDPLFKGRAHCFCQHIMYFLASLKKC